MMMIICLLVLLCSSVPSLSNENVPTPSSKDLTLSEPLLLVSTLDGTLHAISKQTGVVKWKMDENPVLNIPIESTATIKGPTFLPDPHDGSLYAFEPASHGLSKLPFTIQELVQASPCRSSDGILYTGRKQDVWFSINPLTGTKEQVITTESTSDKCPGTAGITKMFIGRSEYKVTMFDTKRNVMRWNVTFTDYSAHANEKVAESYELLHLASSADGFMITVDRQTGRILWAQNYGYPIVALYAWDESHLRKVDLTTVAMETLTHLLRQANRRDSYALFLNNLHFSPKENMLASSLYVGQYQNSLYALPALTHDGVVSHPHRSLQLLPGPNHQLKSQSTQVDIRTASIPIWRLIGYHKIPPNSKINFPHFFRPKRTLLQIEHKHQDKVLPSTAGSGDDGVSDAADDDSITRRRDDVTSDDVTATGNLFWRNVKTLPRDDDISKKYAKDEEPGGKVRWNELTIVASLTSLITGMMFLCCSKKADRGGPTSSHQRDGMITVGRIRWSPVDILGRGSEGTIVYRGYFDGRHIAVKRVVPECFTFADREVALLRESDEHSHVIRYFCTERDEQFQYIALELCSNTLQEYVENPRFQCSTGLEIRTVLHQAMMGLDHLHRLNIVHRDVKPSNILISVPGKLGRQRVVISDFGLCKKLSLGRVSFSHRSGAAGTDGWIAPEMILDKKYRMTQAVDIFSMGCVFYYVICGRHPFGDAISRQARIIAGEYSLHQLRDFDYAEEAMDVVRRMLMIDPQSRPKSDTVLSHPIFWDASKTLQFYEDVSDRVEKEPHDGVIMQRLDTPERDLAASRDWMAELCALLKDDLNKFRSYRSTSVKDLLRAIRNKRHHYRELPEDVKRSLGPLPDHFLAYFASRFPRLLVHTWLAMSRCCAEPEMTVYYGNSAKAYGFDDVTSGETTNSGGGTYKTRPAKPGGVRRPTPVKSMADTDMNWRQQPDVTSQRAEGARRRRLLDLASPWRSENSSESSEGRHDVISSGDVTTPVVTSARRESESSRGSYADVVARYLPSDVTADGGTASSTACTTTYDVIMPADGDVITTDDVVTAVTCDHVPISTTDLNAIAVNDDAIATPLDDVITTQLDDAIVARAVAAADLDVVTSGNAAVVVGDDVTVTSFLPPTSGEKVKTKHKKNRRFKKSKMKVALPDCEFTT